MRSADSCVSLPAVFNNKVGTRESPRPKAGTHGRDVPAPPLPPPPPPPPPLLRERSERAEAREHARELQALAGGRGSANGLPSRRAGEELRKQVLRLWSHERSTPRHQTTREGGSVEGNGCHDPVFRIYGPFLFVSIRKQLPLFVSSSLTPSLAISPIFLPASPSSIPAADGSPLDNTTPII